MPWECRMGDLSQQWGLGKASREGWLWPESGAGRVKSAWVRVGVRARSTGCFRLAGDQCVVRW